MGILSLCTDSGRPPGHTMSSSSSPDPDNPLTKVSLHVISDSPPNHYGTPPPVPIQPPPTIFIHTPLSTQATLWLQLTLHFKELLLLFVLLGFALSWLPLIAFLSSTFYLSISLTANDIATIIEDDTAHNLTQTTRKRTNERTNDRLNERMNERPNQQMNEQTNARMNEQMNDRMNEQKNERTNECTNE